MGFNMYRLLLSVVSVSIVIGFIWYKFHTLENKLDEANTKITTLTKNIEIKTVLIANRDNSIDTLEANIKDLTSTIDKNNADIKRKNKLIEITKNNLNKWRNKPDTIKYKYIYKTVVKKDTDYTKGICSDGLQLNQSMARIKYEDL